MKSAVPDAQDGEPDSAEIVAAGGQNGLGKPSRRLEAVACVFLFFIAHGIYLVSLRQPFFNDDFMNISHAMRPGIDWDWVLMRKGDVFLPLSRLYLEALAAFAGPSPVPYYLGNIVLHALNAWLVYRLASFLFRSPRTGWIACLAFSIVPAYGQTLLFISARAFLLSATGLLISANLFARFVRSLREEGKPGWGYLVGTCASYLLMQGLYAYGPEVPLLFLVLYFVAAPAPIHRSDLGRGLFSMLPLCATLALYLGLTFVLASEDGRPIEFEQVPFQPLQDLPRTLGFLAGGLYHGFARIAFGFPLAEKAAELINLGGPGTLHELFLIGLVLCLLLVNFRFDSVKLRSVSPVMIFGLVFAFGYYLIPAIRRVPFGYEIFVTSDRYRYLPAIGISLIAAGLISSARLRTSRQELAFAYLIGALLTLMVLASGCIHVWETSSEYRRQGISFLNKRENLRRSLDQVLAEEEGQILIRNQVFMTTGAAFFSTTPENVLGVDLPERRSRIQFVPPREFEAVSKVERAYIVDSTGTLVPAS